ncbi:MAG: OmpH family outer membrane protein [Deltaproteobacteria bacterium]|nr:OmpH family outer membrane protein [Deltaproteobacteria bacterium]
MKKSFLFSAIIVVILLVYSVVLAEDFARVGVLDLQRCLKESKEGQKVIQVLKEKKDDLQRRLDTKQRELLELKKELDKQSMMLSMDAQDGKKRAITRKTRELEYLYKDLNEEMTRLQGKEQQRIFKELEKIIEKIGSEENYTLIMEKRAGGVLYFSESIDITDQVIKAYEQMNEANK